MSIRKKLLTLVLVVLLAFNMFLIGAYAETEPDSLVGIDVNLQIYKGGVPLTPGTQLNTNDIITVRVAPTTDFFTGASKIIVMYTTEYLQIQVPGGIAKNAYTVNTANTFYSTSCTDYSGTTNQIPESSWPAALKSIAKGGNGSFSSNTAATWTTVQSGTYPSHMPGTWLFSFDLKVLKNITASSGAKVWMDSRWFKSSTSLTPIGMFSKNLDNTKVTTLGTSQNYPFTFDFTEANISLEPSSNVNITWNANGGTGGTTTSVANGTIPTPPTVTRTGYSLTGWTPAIVAATADTTYTAQWSTDKVGTFVTLTKTETNMEVNVQGWEAGDQYQIWTYQHITSDYLIDTASDVKADQWILSMAYASGSSGDIQEDGSTTFTIPNFVSPDSNYTVAVRIKDNSGNFVKEIRDSYTAAEVGDVVITDILVDGTVTPGYEIKEIKTGAEVLIKAFGNGVSGTTFSATAVAGGTSINLAATGINEFLWDISGLNPATYTVSVSATNGSTTDTQEILFKLYSLDTNITYASINDLQVSWASGIASITPTFDNGTFSYRLKESGRDNMYVSTQYETAGTQTYPITAPGVYLITGLATRAGIIGTEKDGTYDDGIIKMLVVPRPGDGKIPHEMTFLADQTLPDVPKGTAITFTADASAFLPGPVQYSFWRVDATGDVLVKDWSTSNTLAWTPARVGLYTIEARARGVGAGSFEAKKDLHVNVTDTVDQTASVSGITINSAELNANAQAKKPIAIKANATSLNGDNLLYKFMLYDADMMTSDLQGYSVNQHCVWTPREAGTYTISVLVKSDDSFGQFDAIESTEIVVG